MLKIKDNVDLKELEKFGFREALSGRYYHRNFTVCKNRTLQVHNGRKL